MLPRISALDVDGSKSRAVYYVKQISDTQSFEGKNASNENVVYAIDERPEPRRRSLIDGGC